MTQSHTEERWEVSPAKTADGEFMVCAGEGHDYGLIATVLTEADARKVAAAPALLAALKWALPLAMLAIETRRIERVKAGHADITGIYSDGQVWVGLHQSEVDDIERARSATASTQQEER